MSKYSEVSTSTEVNASAPCSVEFGLKAKFPDDKGQIYPAKGIPYRANTPQGVIEGTLDGNGETIIQDTGIGSVRIEVLPDVDTEIAKLRASIKSALDTVIKEERAQGKALEAQYNKKDTLDKALINTGAVLQGGWNIIKGVGEAIGAVAHEAGEYILDPLNAPETFKEDVQAVKAKYHALKATTTEAIEAYEILKDDPKTLAMFEEFASDYIDAQHHTELLEGGSEAVIGIIITVLTAGAGAAVAGGRIAVLAGKIGAKVKKIVELIRQRKWFKKKKTVESNKREVVVKEQNGGKKRAAKYSHEWPKASKKDAIEKFGCNPKPIESNQKLIYKNKETGIDIVEDKEGGYFRIQDTSHTGRKPRYLDLEGKYPQNEIIDGKQIGISASKRNKITHFYNID